MMLRDASLSNRYTSDRVVFLLVCSYEVAIFIQEEVVYYSSQRLFYVYLASIYIEEVI